MIQIAGIKFMPMSKKDAEILEEVKYYEERYFTWDEPVPFCGMLLYPVETRYYNEFLSSSECLTLNKNDDPDGIRLTHLDYLISKMTNEETGTIFSFKFSRLIELVFHLKNGMVCKKCGHHFPYDEVIQMIKDEKNIDHDNHEIICGVDGCDGHLSEVIKYAKDDKTNKTVLLINGNKITTDDFARFRKIVMYQNLPDYKDDSWVDREVREDQAAKQEILSKGSGKASLERKMVCIAAKSNYKIDEIKSMSMRKMIMLLGVIQDAIDYQVTKTGLMSGFVSLKKGQTVDHWIYKQDEGLYGKAVDANAYKSQIQNA